MPTLYWLVGRVERDAVSRLEAAGGVKAAERQLDRRAVRAAHERYAAEREDALEALGPLAALEALGPDAVRPDAVRPDAARPRPTGGVGGTRQGVKCLHAHLAWYLAGGDDPVGSWTAQQLGLVRDGYCQEGEPCSDVRASGKGRTDRIEGSASG